MFGFPSILFVAPLLVLVIFYAYFRLVFRKRRAPQFFLERSNCNPLLYPEKGENWEEMGVFNPGVFQDDNGTHILYRAIGADGVSRIGYARSQDGFNIEEKSPVPIFSMRNPRYGILEENKHYDLVMYPSGGSWGGAEDPRVVKIDGRIYMTFNAFDNWDNIRIAVSSISEKDFEAEKWNWSRPLLISAAGEQNKNWVLFPEKINGKFAILHGIAPHIRIDYVDELENLHNGFSKIKSAHNHGGYGYIDESRKDFWDTRVKGVGPPPVKTGRGWLVLYHAVSDSQYKLGAMLLDAQNPKKIIARSPHPILIPNEWYENNWKPGIVYACGATVKGDDLKIYYGGGDRYLCSASTSLSKLLDWLLTYGFK